MAVVENAPASKTGNWRDIFVWQRSTESARYDLYASIYGTGGLLACTRQIAAGVPSPVVNTAWR